VPILPIQILRFVDEHQPGFVECAFRDANGAEHRFVEKAPVVSLENLSSSSVYPRAGALACEVEATWVANDGHALSRISTERPWGIESTEGLWQFVVRAECLQP
jgi:hypothetical protein